MDTIILIGATGQSATTITDMATVTVMHIIIPDIATIPGATIILDLNTVDEIDTKDATKLGRPIKEIVGTATKTPLFMPEAADMASSQTPGIHDDPRGFYCYAGPFTSK